MASDNAGRFVCHESPCQLIGIIAILLEHFDTKMSETQTIDSRRTSGYTFRRLFPWIFAKLEVMSLNGYTWRFSYFCDCVSDGLAMWQLLFGLLNSVPRCDSVCQCLATFGILFGWSWNGPSLWDTLSVIG